LDRHDPRPLWHACRRRVKQDSFGLGSCGGKGLNTPSRWRGLRNGSQPVQPNWQRLPGRQCVKAQDLQLEPVGLGINTRQEDQAQAA